MHNFHICVLCQWEVTFFQTWICMAMIFEPYLDCYSSIFSPNLVCCSWDAIGKVISNFQSDVGNVVKFSYQNVKHITLICQHDKLPLVRWYVHSTYHLLISYESYYYYFFFLSVHILSPWYLKNRINNHLQIFTVSLSISGIDRRSFSVWSLNHDVIQAPFCVFTLSMISSYPFFKN